MRKDDKLFEAIDLFDEFISQSIETFTQDVENQTGIVEFAEDIVFNGEEKLYIPQRAILKSFYKEPLDEDELTYLSEWKADNRTTWLDGRQYSNLILEAGRGSGKCFSVDTPILTTKGWKSMQDVHPGDYVFNPSGQPVLVIAESEVFIDPELYEVKFDDGSSIKANGSHQWLTWDKPARKALSRSNNPIVKPQIRTTSEIKDTIYHHRKDSTIELNHSILSTKPLELPEADLPIHPYLLGYWLGDGNSRDARITVSIEDSAELLFKLSEWGYEYTVAQYETNCYRVYVKAVAKYLKELNLVLNKHIPDIYLYASAHQRLQLLRGLMDSDGTVSSRSYYGEFGNSNKLLAEQVLELVISLGGISKIRYKQAKLYGVEKKMSYRVTVRFKDLVPFSLYRKVAIYKPYSKELSSHRRIIEVNPIKSEPVKCIQVIGGMYLAGRSLIPTHNSTMIAIIALYEFYNLISLSSPAKYYKLLPGSPIAILAIAQSQDQVKETLFKAIRGYAEGSRYFRSLIKNRSIDIGVEEVRHHEKKVSIFAKHTNSKSLVGYSIKCLILDEAARFEYDDEGNSKADGIYFNVGKGVRRFGTSGRKIAISSAWENGDYIEKLYELAERSPDSLGFRLKTWQVNLNPNNSEYNIKASDDYTRDPITAATEYEGTRVSKRSAFFDTNNVLSAFTGVSVCDARQIPIDITNSQGEIRNYTGIQIDRISHSNVTSFAHCDYGIRKDGAAFALASPHEIEAGRWGISVDILLLWNPYTEQSRSNKAVKRIVSFINCEDVFLDIAKYRNIVKFSFDSFQSENTIQKLHVQGISTCTMSTANNEQLKYYTTTKTLLDHNLLILPRDSNWTNTGKVDLSNIIQLPNGKITHTSNYGKDIPDAIVNAVYNCYLYMIQTGKLNSSNAMISHISKVSSNNAVQTGMRDKLRADGKPATIRLKKSK